MRSLPPNVVEHVLQWLDLASHLRLREASRFDRDETPRRTTTLAARDCEQARRCQEKIFTADKNTRLHSITLDIAAPNSSRSSFRGGGGGSSSGSSSPPPPPRTHHLWSYNSSFSSFLDEASCAARRAALPLLVREHRPAELWFKNMVRGGEFSDALLSLEENLDRVREDTRVLHLGLATGGPRPYQDPRSHHWCLLRLRRLLGPAPSSGGGAAEGAETGGQEAGEDALRTELADLTKDLLGAAAAAAAMPHLVGADDGGLEEVEEDEVRRPRRGDRAAQRASPGVGKAYWPRLSELRLSCGIMAGDLEGLAGCLGSLPHLQVLDLRGHSFRPPTTDFMALARALQASASAPSPTAPAFRAGGLLRTLTLKCFKVEGAAGVTALGEALSAERFPSLAALSIDSCRLTNRQLCALSAALPGMSRTLTSLSLRSNYALSEEGVKALADALRTGSASASALASAGGSRSGCSCSGAGCCSDDGDAVSSAPEEAKTEPLLLLTTAWSAACCFPFQNPDSISEDRPAGAPAPGSSAAATKSPPPQRAPAWSVPSPSPPPPTPPARPSSSISPSCTCRRRRTSVFASAAAAAAAAAAACDGEGGARGAAPLRIESLDLSYSCWWSSHSRRPRDGREGGRGGGPFASLLEALREGHPCLPLRSLRLKGCYLGDAAMGRLVQALESKTGSCRGLRVLNVNGNLFSEVGVRLFGNAFLSGAMPPHLRMEVGVLCDGKPCYRKLHSDISLEAKKETIASWVEHQNGLHCNA